MGSICLSLAPNLRCQELTLQESIGLVVPPALEVIFCVGLIVVKRGVGLRTEYLLSAEGIIYFFLALLDLLAHRLPSITSSLSRFKALDIFIGISAVVPLTLYSTFLFHLTSKDFVPNLPLRLQTITRYALLCMVPMVLVFNLLGSFATLTYRFVHTGPNASGIGVKFTDATLELFFNSLTLVLFVVFQAINFCACFYRLIQAGLDQRRIDTTTNGNDHERHFINGTGWMALGIKLGAVESVIGFASGDFGLALTRRVLRFLGRACLVIGLIKGLDAVEDFQFIKRSPAGRQLRKSVLMALISSPNPTSFHQIGGYAYEPSIAPPVTVSRSRTIASRTTMPVSPVVSSIRHTETPRQSFLEIPRQSFLSMSPAATSPSKSAYSGTSPSRYTAESVHLPPAPALALDTRRPSSRNSPQRVIVRYRHGRAPTLDFNRFSDLGLPGSEARARVHTLGEGHSPELKAPPLPSPAPFASAPPSAARTSGFPVPSRARHTISEPPRAARRSTALARQASQRSTQSAQSTQSMQARDALEVLHALALEYPGMRPDAASAGIPRDEPSGAPSIADSATYVEHGASPALSRAASERTVDGAVGLVRRGSSVRRKPVPKYDEDELLGMAGETGQAVGVQRAPVPVERAASTLPRNPRPTARPRPGRSMTHPRSRSMPRSTQSSDAILPEAAPIPRIKSIGRVPRQWTPTPSQVEVIRESLVPELHDPRDGDPAIYPTPPGSAARAI